MAALSHESLENLRHPCPADTEIAGLDLLPQGRIHHAGVFTLVRFVFVAHLAYIGGVGQQRIETGLGKGASAPEMTF